MAGERFHLRAYARRPQRYVSVDEYGFENTHCKPKFVLKFRLLSGTAALLYEATVAM